MKALVCSLSGIGNALSTLPLIGALKHLGYSIHVTLSNARNAKPIFEAHPDVYKVRTAPFENIEGYTVFCCCYCVRNLNRTFCGWETNHVVPPFMGDAENCRHRFKKHEIEYFVDLAREVGWTGGVPDSVLPLKPAPFEVPPKSVALSVGYHKGDGHSHSKHWGNENYVELAKLLSKRGYTPIFIGSKDDWIADAHALSTKLPCRSLTPRPIYAYDQSLLAAFGILNDCCAYVGNETCMVPAAAALKKPVLSLIMKSATPTLICPQKNYPYPNGMALLGHRKDMTPAVVFDLIVRLIEDGPIQEIMEL